MEVEKPKLIYVGDPMCSWCYGVSEELSQTIDHFGDQLDLEILMGGLRAGGGEEWNQSFKDFLRKHWEDVGMRSGQPFAFKLLDKAHFDYDTEPACRSVVVIEEIDKTKTLAFFKEVQKGFYVWNRDPKEVEFYKPICESLAINFDDFSSKFASEEMKKATNNHFYRSGALGVRSFPTVLLEYKGKQHVIAVGFSTFEQMKAKIEVVLR